MKNKGSIWSYIAGVSAIIAGVIYAVSLIFLPVAIYCFIYAKFFFKIAKLTSSEFASIKSIILYPAIIVSVLAFPLGLISLVTYFLAGANVVKITEANDPIIDPNLEFEKIIAEVDEIQVTEKEEPAQYNLSPEDLEKLEKLTNFKNQGLLTEEEFIQAKNQLLNKNNN